MKTQKYGVALSQRAKQIASAEGVPYPVALARAAKEDRAALADYLGGAGGVSGVRMNAAAPDGTDDLMSGPKGREISDFAKRLHSGGMRMDDAIGVAAAYLGHTARKLTAAERAACEAVRPAAAPSKMGRAHTFSREGRRARIHTGRVELVERDGVRYQRDHYADGHVQLTRLG